MVSSTLLYQVKWFVFDKHLFVYEFLEFSVADYPKVPEVDAKPTNSVCYYSGKRYPPEHPKKYQLTTEYWFEITIKFIFAILFEVIKLIENISDTYKWKNFSTWWYWLTICFNWLLMKCRLLLEEDWNLRGIGWEKWD